MKQDEMNPSTLPQQPSNSNPSMGTSGEMDMDGMMAEFFAELDVKLNDISAKLDQLLSKEIEEE